MLQRSKLIFCAMCLVGLVVVLNASQAHADAIFTLGNHPDQPSEENILFSAFQTGSTITGITNQSQTVVNFTSASDILVVTALGQAQVTASDGKINNITLSIPGGTFTDLIINPFSGGTSAGTANITVVLNDGTQTFSYSLGNGQNFLTITTTGGEKMSSVTIDVPNGFTYLKQPRISGVAITPVPEPSSLLMLGSGLVGVILRGRKFFL